MNKKAAFSNIIITLGALLLLASLVLIGKNLYEEKRAEKLSLSASIELVGIIKNENTPVNPFPAPSVMPDPDREMPVKTINGKPYIGILNVPALGLELPVINEWSYENFTVSPCRYDGSVYKNNMIIAAHNYRSHFARLRTLSLGDSVLFTDMNSDVFNYEVVETEILLPEQVDDMKSGDWDLTLFTCTFGGEYRITVRCKQK